MGQQEFDELATLAPDVRRFRVVVTGHDAQDRSVIISDRPSPHVMTMMGLSNFAATDFWKTFVSPADNSENTAADPCLLPI